ncbi:threonine/serine exporter family protein [Xanthomonadaceae bacterium XH05]|nr:threonine/serine exporter family protein [Xanthomonadaceae bacterium XH05]
MTHPPYAARVEFVIELATRLHIYGTTAQRLEGAISAVATRLGLRCEPWSNPTGLILSFSDASRPETLANTTQVIRLAPGEVDLRKLCEVDAIAERVLRGETGVSEAVVALHALDAPAPMRDRVLSTLAFGLTSAAVATLLRGTLADVMVAGGVGLLIGVLYAFAAGHARLTEALELIAALLATLLATAVATFLLPLSLKTVIVASLIVLLPGMMLTNAVSELTSQHLVSGMARFSGAMALLLKLAFGSMMASQFILLLHWSPIAHVDGQMLPGWSEGAALLAAALAFAVLFKAAWRDYPLVMAAAVTGYLITRIVGVWLPGSASVFLASVVVTLFSNIYARAANRPGALIRVPGIILMVPGSVGFRGVSSMFEQNVVLGLDTAVNLTTILVALVGGMLIGNVLLPARRNL